MENKNEQLEDARYKIKVFDEIMYELYENEKQVRFEAEIIDERLKMSQDLNITHREKNTMLSNNLKEA